MYNFKITLNHQKVILNQTVNTDVLFKNFTDQYLLHNEPYHLSKKNKVIWITSIPAIIKYSV